jgi:D-alanine-D-alanine ligase
LRNVWQLNFLFSRILGEIWKMRRKKIALLAGGWAGEREVSLKSGEAVYKALDRDRYLVSRYDPSKELEALIRARDEIDLAFVLLHGRFGEDGRIQGLLDILKIPFVGSGVLASAMAMDKNVAKGIFREAGLEVAEDVVLTEEDSFSCKEILERVGPAVIVKPVSEGSSLGASVCRSEEELEAGMAKAFHHDREVMVEEYIRGREITCCVLGNRELETLPLVEIVPSAGYAFFDYEAKYTPGATEEVCPAPLSPAQADRARACARAAHRALKCRVWSRTDMIMREDRFCLLETNTIPGMTENSLFPLAARSSGLTLTDLLDRLIELSLEN